MILGGFASSLFGDAALVLSAEQNNSAESDKTKEKGEREND